MVRYLLILLGICIGIYSYSQGGGSSNINVSDYNKMIDILPPSPNAASLGKYGNADINLSSGAFNTSIPLLTYQSIKLNLPISISYYTVGFKVDELASRVGVGWNLNAGGVITRTVFGAVDEQAGRLAPPSNFTTRSAVNYMESISSSDANGPADSQPDLFTFNFNGNTGKFMLDNDLNPILLTYSGIKIEKDFNGTEWNFRITTNDGIQYLFGGSGATETMERSSVGTGCGRIFPDFSPTAWYLKRIVHPNGDWISFSYTTIGYYYTSSISQSIFKRKAGSYIGECFCQRTITSTPSQPNSTTCSNSLHAQTMMLSEINSSGGAKVKFSYISRSDCGDKLLSKIELFQFGKTTALKTYNFTYSQVFTSHNLNSFSQSDNSLRYWPFLTGVTEKGESQETGKVYSFEYNDKENVPARLSYSQDDYGFYNGKNNSTLIPKPDTYEWIDALPTATANRSTDVTYAKKGLLSAIIYPTGGRQEIAYESNQVYESVITYPPKVSVEAYGTSVDLEVPNTYYSPTALVSFFQEAKLTGACSHNTTGEGDPIHDHAIVQLKDIITSVIIYSQTVKPDNSFEANINLLPNHTYQVIVIVGGEETFGSGKLEYIAGTITQQNQNVNAGGVRVSKITSIPTPGSNSIKTFKYYNPSNENISSGYRIFQPVYQKILKQFTRCSDYPLVGGGPPPAECWEPNTLEFDNYSMFSSSLNNLFMFTTPVSYSTVIESLGENFEGGGVQHDFTIHPDDYANVILGDEIISAPNTDFSWANARETYTYTFKQSGSNWVPVKKVFMHYTDDSRVDQEIRSYVVNKRYLPFVQASPPDDFELNAYQVVQYYHYRKWSYVDKVTTYNYNTAGTAYTEDIQNMAYSNTVHAQPTTISVKQSDGTYKDQKNFYPNDLTLSGTAETARQSLVSKHIYAPVLKQQILKGTSSLLTVTNEYKNFTTNNPLLLTTSTQLRDQAVQQMVQFDSYDTYGNILQQHKVNNVNHSYIWGYNNTYPIAEAINAKSNEIYTTSFEEGGWGGNLQPNTTHVHGGSQAGYIDNSGGTTEKTASSNQRVAVNLTATRKFHFSGWVYSSAPSAEIFLMMTTTPGGSYTSTSNIVSPASNAGKWVLLEKDVDVPASIKEMWLRVDNNGSGQVWYDDLRLYPSDARMTTYTYQPLVGMTSQSDANNRVTYYAYDGLGRLSSVKDQDGNIIKTYCYNYAGQLTDCRTPFQNITQSRTFIKNDCTDTALCGAEVEATVVMGTFTSDSSQEEADSLAKAYLDSTGQTYANTNGECLAPMNILMDNYEHVAGFTIQLTSVYDSTKIYTISFPEDADSSISLQRIPQGHYNIVLSKTDNAQSFLFTVSGPAGEIQVNSDKGSWNNVLVNLNTFYRIAIGILNQ